MKNAEIIQTLQIGDVLAKYIFEKNIIFVFPSDIAMDTWSDWCVKNSSVTKVRAVPLEKFTSWDKFKMQFAATGESGRTCIPSVLRKFFARKLLDENAEKHFLKSLVPEKYASDALHFADWISKILPSLGLWKKKIGDRIIDDEDRDMMFLYEKYKSYLDHPVKGNDDVKFFESAWLTPEFRDESFHFVIFYPELLEDYEEYRNQFDKKNVTLVNVPDEMPDGKIDAVLYDDARKELRKTVLKIRELIESKKVLPSEISLTVTDLKTSRPYVERELKKYCVPYVVRSGSSCVQNCAGRAFLELRDCVKSNFALDDMRAFLQDGFLPWKNVFLNEKIIRLGNETRSVCSYYSAKDKRTHDALLEAVRNSDFSDDEKKYFFDLTEILKSICKAPSFQDIMTLWHSFEGKFLRKDFSCDVDNIFGVCIAELSELIDIEKDYLESLGSFNCYDFFINELQGKNYVPQNKKIESISVFDYKLSAAAHFEYQFVINASQKNVTVVYKPLSFLSEEKRLLLGICDLEEPTIPFIKLYAKNGKEKSLFSCSTNGFAGFSILHTFFNEINPFDDYLDDRDFYINEKKYLLENGDVPKSLTELQVSSCKNWYDSQKQTHVDASFVNCKILSDAKRTLIYDNEDENPQKMNISSTVLKCFFPCPRKWIFKNVLSLKEDSLDTSLLQKYDFGNICHGIVENLFRDNFVGKVLPEYRDDGTSGWEEDKIREMIKKAAQKVIALDDFKSWKTDDYKKSALVISLLQTMIPKYVDFIYEFMKDFCKVKKGRTFGFAHNTVAGVEQKMKVAVGNEYNLYGKIDCIVSDSSEDTIVDYKTGMMPERKECYPEKNVLKDFQMAVYGNLLEKDKRYNLKGAVFYSLKNRDFKKNRIVGDDLKETGGDTVFDVEYFRKDVLCELESYIMDFMDKMSSADFEPKFKTSEPHVRVKTYTECADCMYRDICRTTFNLAGRKN